LRHHFAGPVLRASVVPTGSTDWLKGARVVAWAGIGAPQRFFATLQALGADVVETIAFRDHQLLGEDDARRLLDLARRHSAALVTTEKDMARLAGAHGLCGELKGATREVPVRLTLAEADAERLFSLIATALQAPRS
jgi:tetraacyldisaccharide 4'-kinase